MKSNPTILAIETSCDETAAAVIKSGKVLSNIIASQASIHSKFGGVVPEIAAREHVPTIIPTIRLALKEAKVKLADIEVVAVTNGPGLATSLHTGIDAAKTLSMALDVPLLPVNHMEAHIYANFIESEVFFPALILVVSGGHTILVLMKKHGVYQILGQTLDDAAGEAFDKTAKVIGLGYPGGPMISKLAEDGNRDAFKFPRPMIKSGDLDFSFSGLKTAVLYEVQKHKSLNKQDKKDLSASLQEAIVETLVSKTRQAANKYSPRTLMLGGGVAANKQLRERIIALANELNINVSIPPLSFCTDNAAMIGLAAHYRIKNKKAKFSQEFSANPNLKLK